MSGKGRFVPNEDILTTLISMGIDKNVAELALFKTGNQSCDAAISYVFDSAEERPKRKSRKGKSIKGTDDKMESSTRTFEEEDFSTCFKMVFVVNESLKMSVGKTSAQVAHACLGLYKKLSTNSNEWVEDDDDVLDSWEESGEKKVVLRAMNHLQLLELQQTAELAELPTYLVEDAGRTELPAGALTVLSIFGYEDAVNTVTGDLDLLH